MKQATSFPRILGRALARAGTLIAAGSLAFAPVAASAQAPSGRGLSIIRDAEIEQLLKTAHGRVRETLGAKRAILEALAKRLIEKEVVDREALTRLIAETGATFSPRP